MSCSNLSEDRVEMRYSGQPDNKAEHNLTAGPAVHRLTLRCLQSGHVCSQYNSERQLRRLTFKRSNRNLFSFFFSTPGFQRAFVINMLPLIADTTT